MRKLYLSLGLGGFVLALALAPWAQAAEFIAPDRQAQDGNVTVSSTETHRNLYLGGGNVTINGATTGDLYAGGGTVVINGDVEQDLTSAGGNLVVNGKVGGDARIGGGSININGPVGGDLLVAGGNVLLGEKATVAGDLIICGGTVKVDGAVNGSVRAGGGRVVLNSAIAGPVMVRSRQLVFGPGAKVAQTVEYRGEEQAVVQAGAQVGTINFQELQQGRHGARRAVAGAFTAVFLFKLIAYIVAALVALRLLKRPAYAVVNHVYQSPWSNLGIGLLCAIVIPIVAIVLMLTVVGFYVGLVLLLALGLAVLLSVIGGAMFLGALLVKWLMKKPNLVLDWQAVLIGTVVLAVVGLVPVLGALVCAIVVLMALGATLRLTWQWLKQQGGASAVM